MALYVNGKQISGGGGGGNTNSVELTYAEYQALTPEQQLDGTEYFITDINGDGQQFQPICYSDEEKEIGVWRDGKPLYEKTIAVTQNSSSETSISLSGLNIDTFFVESAFMRSNSNGDTTPTTYFVTSGDKFMYWYNRTNDRLVIQTASWQGSGYITIRYTKTTDQAGSGTWTPQGVPAHHYSTDEQVVGTWVDGNTLYEKTITFTAPSSNAYTSQSLGVTVDYISIIETSIIKGSQVGTLCGAYNGNPANDEWQGYINLTNSTLDYRVGSSYYGADCYVTIQYTKSST